MRAPKSPFRQGLSLALLLAGATAVVAYFAAAGRGRSAAGSPPIPRTADRSSDRSAGNAAGPAISAPRTSQERAAASPTSNAQRASTPIPLRCLVRSTHAPLRGVVAYRDGDEASGPSDGDGTLLLSGMPAYGALTLWTSGWSPVVVELQALPEEVLFDPEDANLVVRTLNPGADWHLFRGLLQPRRVPPPPSGPWDPVFVEEAPDTYVVRDVAPGTFDLYIWLVSTEGASRSLNHNEVVLEPSRTTEITFDLATIPADDDQEDDS